MLDKINCDLESKTEINVLAYQLATELEAALKVETEFRRINNGLCQQLADKTRECEKYLTRIQMVEEYKINDQLRTENVELKKDKERLDWLERHQEIKIMRAEFGGKMQWWLHRITPHDLQYDSLRTAIDAARKEQS